MDSSKQTRRKVMMALKQYANMRDTISTCLNDTCHMIHNIQHLVDAGHKLKVYLKKIDVDLMETSESDSNEVEITDQSETIVPTPEELQSAEENMMASEERNDDSTSNHSGTLVPIIAPERLQPAKENMMPLEERTDHSTPTTSKRSKKTHKHINLKENDDKMATKKRPSKPTSGHSNLKKNKVKSARARTSKTSLGDKQVSKKILGKINRKVDNVKKMDETVYRKSPRLSSHPVGYFQTKLKSSGFILINESNQELYKSFIKEDAVEGNIQFV